MTPQEQDLNCTTTGCACTRFSTSAEKSHSRQCDECRHGWVAHALDAVTRNVLAAAIGATSFPSVGVVQSMARLILYGSQAVPVRLKVLLDRLLRSLRPDKVGQLLSDLGWSEDDYGKGYIYQDSTGRELKKWTMPSDEEEFLILRQFLRFPFTRSLAEEFLSNCHSSRLTGSDVTTDFQQRYPLTLTGSVTAAPRFLQERPDFLGHIRNLEPGCHNPHDAFPYAYPPPPPPPAMTLGFGTLLNPLASPILDMRSRGDNPPAIPFFSRSPSRLMTHPYEFLRFPFSPDLASLKQLRGHPSKGERVEAKREFAGFGHDEPTSRSIEDRLPSAGDAEFLVRPPPRQGTAIQGETGARVDSNGAINYSTRRRNLSRNEVPITQKTVNIPPSKSDTKRELPPVAKKRHCQQVPGYGGTMILSSGKKRVLCTACKKTFCDKGALKIHYSAVHLKEMHKCTLHGCDMMFSSRRSRNRHSANPNPKLHTTEARLRGQAAPGRTDETAKRRTPDGGVRALSVGGGHGGLRHEVMSESSESCSSWMTRDDDVDASSQQESAELKDFEGRFNGEVTQNEFGQNEMSRDGALNGQTVLFSSSSHASFPAAIQNADKTIAYRNASKRKIAAPLRWSPKLKGSRGQAENGNATLSSVLLWPPMPDEHARSSMKYAIAEDEEDEDDDDDDEERILHSSAFAPQDQPIDCSRGAEAKEGRRLTRCKRNLFGGTVYEPSAAPRDGRSSSGQRKDAEDSSAQDADCLGCNDSCSWASPSSASDSSLLTVCSEEPANQLTSPESSRRRHHPKRCASEPPGTESQSLFPRDGLLPDRSKTCNAGEGPVLQSELQGDSRLGALGQRLSKSCDEQGTPRQSDDARMSFEYDLKKRAISQGGTPPRKSSPCRSTARCTPSSAEDCEEWHFSASKSTQRALEDNEDHGFTVESHSEAQVKSYDDLDASKEQQQQQEGDVESRNSVDQELTSSSNDSIPGGGDGSGRGKRPVDADPNDPSGASVPSKPSPDPGGSVACHICFQLFRDNLILKEHIEKVHPKEMYLCNIKGCNKVFSTRKSRNRHSQNENLHRHLCS